MSARPEAAASRAADESASDVSRPRDALELADCRRRVFELYRGVGEARGPVAAWSRWRAGRDDLFAHHPESPLPAGERGGFGGLA
jgi:hypothetical protein